MQINSVGSNNYGYSNQKVQKNNSQPSFGIIGGSLRAQLVKLAPAIRTMNSHNNRLALQTALGALEKSGLVAEFGDAIKRPDLGVFIRDGQQYRFYGAQGNYFEQLAKAAPDAQKYDAAKALAESEESAISHAQQAIDEQQQHDLAFIDKLISEEYTETSLTPAVSTGTDLDAAQRSTKEILDRVKTAKNEVAEFFPHQNMLSGKDVETLDSLSKKS